MKKKLMAVSDESAESNQTHLMLKEMINRVIAEEVRILRKYQNAVAAPVFRCEKYTRIVSNPGTPVAGHSMKS